MVYGKFSAKGGFQFTCIGLTIGKFLSVLSIGLPSALDRLYKTVQTFVVNHLLLIVATGTSVAAYGVLTSVSNIFMPFVMGITTTGLTMAGMLFGEDGVWYGFVVGEALAVVLTLIIVAIMKKRLPRTADDMLFLPALYDKVKTTASDWSATTLDEVKEVGRKVRDFMQQLGSNETDESLMQQLVEELGNVITNWNADKKGQLYIDIRLVGLPPLAADGTPQPGNMTAWKFRIRDNGKQFDVQQWEAIHHGMPRHETIRTVDQRAKDITYTYTLDMNYLFVTI